jgi:hypothetical protein
MATNKQIEEILKVNEGTAHSTPSWENNGETYQIEINNPCELYMAKQGYITYAIQPVSGAVNPTTDLQLVVIGVRGDGAELRSDVNPEEFEWYSSTTNVSVDANGLVSWSYGDGTAYVGAIARGLNPDQIPETDSILSEVTYTSI